MGQRAIRTVYMRGGTSRALFFRDDDLPPIGGGNDSRERDALFCGAIGSPDPYKRQLNGVGGGVTSLSKIAVIGAPTHPDADIDYTFGQVDVTQPTVSYRGNCGNISSAVGPYAVDEGLVGAPRDGVASVMIHNTNTGKLIRSTFDVIGGEAATIGNFKIDGVAGTGARIELGFLDPGGAVTGTLLPTGRVRDTLDIAGFGKLQVSIVDASNIVTFVDASSIGLTGDERPDILASDARAIEMLRQIRSSAAVAAGLIDTPEQAFSLLRNLPLVAIMSRSGQSDADGPARLRVRMVSSDQPHGASPLTGATCLAIAAQIEGTIAAAMLSRPVERGEILIDHATGVLPVAAIVDYADGRYSAREGIVHRTARRLMDGRVFVA
jgi:2-methylaconitate isomerase